jgi:hypothetical protein
MEDPGTFLFSWTIPINPNEDIGRGHAAGKQEWNLEEILALLLLEKDIEDLEVFNIF